MGLSLSNSDSTERPAIFKTFEQAIAERRIDTTDAEINRLVYELYGLTADEVVTQGSRFASTPGYSPRPRWGRDQKPATVLARLALFECPNGAPQP
jgi:hypothetical protein